MWADLNVMQQSVLFIQSIEIEYDNKSFFYFFLI